MVCSLRPSLAMTPAATAAVAKIAITMRATPLASGWDVEPWLLD